MVDKKKIADYWTKQLDPKRIKRQLTKLINARKKEIAAMKAEAEKQVKKMKKNAKS